MISAVIRLGAFACLLGYGIAAQAQYSGGGSVPWTYVDLSYQGAKIDLPSSVGGDVDGDGLKLAGALQLQKYIHVLGSFERIQPDDIVLDDGINPPVTIPTGDLDTMALGVGFHTPSLGRADRQYRGGLIDRYSLFFDTQYLRRDSDASDRNGYSFDAGFRATNLTRLETLLSFGYEKFEKSDGELTIEGRILYSVFTNLQLQGGVDWNDNLTRWFIGVRVPFGNFSVF